MDGFSILKLIGDSWQELLTFTVPVGDLLIAYFKKSPPFLPFWRLLKESKHLWKVIRDRRFAAWRPKTAAYVALETIEARGNQDSTRVQVLGKLNESLSSGKPLVLLGEPGAGKTTALEALTYQLARRAFIFNAGVWLLLLAGTFLIVFLAPALGLSKLLAALLWLLSFILWEPLVCRYLVPFFIDARADYSGKAVPEWRDELLTEALGRKPLFGSRNRFAMLIDGLNEIQAGYFGPFVEGWRAHLRKNSRARLVFSSRQGEDPSERLEATNPLARMVVCDLSDPAVKEFLKLYRRKKTAPGNNVYASSDLKRDFDELENRGVLGERAIGRNPYWLKMIVESDIYTRNRSVLFQSFAENLINREVNKKPEERKRRAEWKSTVPIRQELNSLAALALVMHEKRRVGFASEEGWREARDAVRKEIGDLPYAVDDVLFQAEAATLIRIETGKRIEFVHQLVQEFFAAYALYDDETKWSQAIDHAEDVWWWQTIFFLAGLLDAEVSKQSSGQFINQILGDQTCDLRIMATIGILRVVDDAPSELATKIAVAFAESIKTTAETTAEGTVALRFNQSQLTALRGLAQALGDDAADAFAILLDDPDRITRYAGSLILCELGGRRAAELMIAHADDEIHANTGMDLIASLGEAAVDPLLLELQMTEYDTRRQIQRALTKIGTPAVDRLILSLKDEMPYVRSAAAETLGIIRDPRAVAPLIKLVGDTDELRDVREAGAEALGEMRERAVDQLLTAVKESGSKTLWPLVGAEDATRRYLFDALGKTRSPRAIEYLIKALGDEDDRLRKIAQTAVGKLEDVAVRPLLTALKDDNVQVRRSAAMALATLGHEIAVMALIDALSDEDGEVRSRAAASLGRIGDLRAVEPLISMLSGEDHKAAASVAEALGDLRDQRAVASLIRALKSPSDNLQEKSAEALGKIGDPNAVNALATMLEEKSYFLKKTSAEALARLGEEGIRRVLASLKARRADDRYTTEGALGKVLAEMTKTDLEKVIGFIRDEDPTLRSFAVKALGHYELAGNRRAVEALTEAIKDNDLAVRRKVPGALGMIGKSLGVDGLIEALKDTDAQVRASAAQGLGFTRDARAVVPLRNALKDENEDVRKHSAWAIGSLDDAGAVDDLIGALRDESPVVRAAAADGLRYLRNPAAAAALISALNDEQQYVRGRVAMALGQLRHKPAVEPLLSLVASGDEFRTEVIEALALIGDARAVEPIIGMLRNRDQYIRKSAVEALGKIGDSRALKPLIPMLRGSDSDLRAAAAEALGEIGHEDAMGPLKASLKDDDFSTRWAAENALAKIKRRAARGK